MGRRGLPRCHRRRRGVPHARDRGQRCPRVRGVDGGTRRADAGPWTPWDGYGWQAPTNVSASSAYAMEPSVTTTAYGYRFDIVWADTRHGDPEIYLRPWMDGFGAPVRLTDLTGPCRRPSAHAEDCCGDVIDTRKPWSRSRTTEPDASRLGPSATGMSAVVPPRCSPPTRAAPRSAPWSTATPTRSVASSAG